MGQTEKYSAYIFACVFAYALLTRFPLALKRRILYMIFTPRNIAFLLGIASFLWYKALRQLWLA